MGLQGLLNGDLECVTRVSADLQRNEVTTTKSSGRIQAEKEEED